jgi:hypothetical protein
MGILLIRLRINSALFRFGEVDEEAVVIGLKRE